jgi:hypothetical protein
MTWLFDMNVLLAIADSMHVFHGPIHQWLAARSGQSWASCPLTENGFVRVISQPSYRGSATSPSKAIDLLRRMKENDRWPHMFWPDDISLTDSGAVNVERLVSARQVTDVYLASLAHRKKARFVTFDAAIPWQAVTGATESLIEIPAV